MRNQTATSAAVGSGTMRDVFEKPQSKMDTAVTHAERLAEHNRETDSENATTKVHELVKYLRKLKKIQPWIKAERLACGYSDAA